jgi:outer membrane protein assembly factor BamB
MKIGMILFAVMMIGACGRNSDLNREPVVAQKNSRSNKTMNSEIRGSIRWRSEIQHTLLIAPVLTAESVVVVSLAQSSQGRLGFLDALDRATGRRLWSFSGKTGMGVSGGMPAPPVIADNFMYFGSGRGMLGCLDSGTGKLRWETPIGAAVAATPAITNDQIFFASEDGSLIALELQTGRKQWVFKTRDAIRAAPVVSDGRVIVGSWDGNLYAVDAKGALVWKKDLSPARPTAIVIADERIVFFDSATGDVRAVLAKQTAGAWQIEEEWRIPTGRRTGVQPVPAPDMVCFLGGGDARVTCVDVVTGATRWTTAVVSAPLTPVVNGKHLLVASRDGHISALDLQSGAEQWKVETGISLSSDPAVLDGVLYVGGKDQAVYAFALEPEK